jgi:hypothetical protein
MSASSDPYCQVTVVIRFKLDRNDVTDRLIQQLLDGCVQRKQQASSHDKSLAGHNDDSVSEEKIPVGSNSRGLDQTHGSDFSFLRCPASADGSRTDAIDEISVDAILQDSVFLQRCIHNEKGHVAAIIAPPPTAVHEADPFHDDWPYWNQSSTPSEMRHGV